jgi:hypothetical protein
MESEDDKIGLVYSEECLAFQGVIVIERNYIIDILYL